jgi:hypothetical protein
MKAGTWAKGLTWLAGALALVVVAGVAAAYSGGRIGRSGNPATGGLTCNQCHSGGRPPVVVINGPSIVEPGQTATYSLVISGGQEAGGGFNVSADAGELDKPAGATDVQVLIEQMTQRPEVTHTAPKAVDSQGTVTFTFEWTAPQTAGIATLYGAGNSVNFSGYPDGDAVAAVTRAVAVMEEVTGRVFLPAAIR